MSEEYIWSWKDDQRGDFVDNDGVSGTVEGCSILLQSDTLEEMSELISRYTASIPGLESTEIELADEINLHSSWKNVPLSERKPYMRFVRYFRIGTEKDSIFHGFEDDSVREYNEKMREITKELADSLGLQYPKDK